MERRNSGGSKGVRAKQQRRGTSIHTVQFLLQDSTR